MSAREITDSRQRVTQTNQKAPRGNILWLVVWYINVVIWSMIWMYYFLIVKANSGQCPDMTCVSTDGHQFHVPVKSWNFSGGRSFSEWTLDRHDSLQIKITSPDGFLIRIPAVNQGAERSIGLIKCRVFSRQQTVYGHEAKGRAYDRVPQPVL